MSLSVISYLLFRRSVAIRCLDDLNDFYDFYAFYDFYGFNDLPLPLYASARSDSFSNLSMVISPSSRCLAPSIARWATPFL